jgi:hypothetical protein
MAVAERRKESFSASSINAPYTRLQPGWARAFHIGSVLSPFRFQELVDIVLERGEG